MKNLFRLHIFFSIPVNFFSPDVTRLFCTKKNGRMFFFLPFLIYLPAKQVKELRRVPYNVIVVKKENKKEKITLTFMQILFCSFNDERNISKQLNCFL